MVHLDLFSGIGGFALAAETVWPGIEHIFCEIDPYCQALLKKRFPNAQIYGDIRELTADTYTTGQQNRTQEQGGKGTSSRKGVSSISRCDLLTGGFPCQPFSMAGKRRGTADNRYLWPEMLRVIKEFKPAWVIGENVAGIVSMAEQQGDIEVGSQTDLFGNKTDTHTEYGRGVLYGIIGSLEQIGYTVQVFIIPACAVNAPHRRDRVWIVAHHPGDGCRTSETIKVKKGYAEEPEHPGELARGFERPYSDATDTRRKRQEKQEQQTTGNQQYSWNQNWLEVATRFCGVDDGFPAGMDGLELSKARHRVERLKALGNAIVPQVAIEIMRAIKEITPKEPSPVNFSKDKRNLTIRKCGERRRGNG